MPASFVGIGSVALLLPVLLAGGGFGLPLSIPPLPADPVLTRAVPDECLYYLSWNGTAAANPASGNQTEQLLAEPEVRDFLAAVRVQLATALDQLMRGSASREAAAREIPVLLRELLSRPAALYVSRLARAGGGFDADMAIVVHGGSKTSVMAEGLVRLAQALSAEWGDPPDIERLPSESGQLWQMRAVPGAPPVVWGVQGEYLLCCVGETAHLELLARMASSRVGPAWLDRLHAQLPVDRPSYTSYVNVAGILDAAVNLSGDARITTVFDALGLSNVDYFGSVTGLDQDGIVTRSVAAIEGEPEGLFAAIAGAGLSPSDLDPIPRDTSWASAVRLDLHQAYQRMLEAIGQVDPVVRESTKQVIADVERAIGFSFADDLFRPLGSVWCASVLPRAADDPFGLHLVVTCDLRDRRRLAATHAMLLEKLRLVVGSTGMTLNEIPFQREVGEPLAIHSLQMTDAAMANLPFQPAWCLAEDHLVFALVPQTIERWLSNRDSAESLAEVPAVARLLQGDDPLLMLTYQDTAAMLEGAAQLWPLVGSTSSALLGQSGLSVTFPPLPSRDVLARHTEPMVAALERTESGLALVRRQSIPFVSGDAATVAPVTISMLMPVFQMARVESQSLRSARNLQVLGAALRDYDDVFRRLPADSAFDRRGNPGLSWRVHLLPFLDELELYRQFRLDEPWDSDHNRPLIERIPSVYRNPLLGDAGLRGLTNYFALRGDKTLFPLHPPGRPLADATDGTSQTLLVVEADPAAAAPWTQPADLRFDRADPFAGLADLADGDLRILLADGTVHTIKLAEVSAETLQALATCDAGDSPGDF